MVGSRRESQNSSCWSVWTVACSMAVCLYAPQIALWTIVDYDLLQFSATSSTFWLMLLTPVLPVAELARIGLATDASNALTMLIGAGLVASLVLGAARMVTCGGRLLNIIWSSFWSDIGAVFRVVVADHARNRIEWKVLKVRVCHRARPTATRGRSSRRIRTRSGPVRAPSSRRRPEGTEKVSGTFIRSSDAKRERRTAELRHRRPQPVGISDSLRNRRDRPQ